MDKIIIIVAAFIFVLFLGFKWVQMNKKTKGSKGTGGGSGYRDPNGGGTGDDPTPITPKRPQE